MSREQEQVTEARGVAQRCPQGHVCYPARAPQFEETHYYWCPKCESEPGYIAASGQPAQGMYWPMEKLAPVNECPLCGGEQGSNPLCECCQEIGAWGGAA